MHYILVVKRMTIKASDPAKMSFKMKKAYSQMIKNWKNIRLVEQPYLQ